MSLDYMGLVEKKSWKTIYKDRGYTRWVSEVSSPSKPCLQNCPFLRIHRWWCNGHGIACPYSVCPLYFLLLAPVFFIICPRILYCLPYYNLNILYHLPYQLFSLAPNYKSISFQHNFNSCIMLMCMKILLYFSTTYITL